MSGTAKVLVNESDKTQRVSGQSEAFVAGVIPAVSGPIEPFLITSNTSFYNQYTPENKYKSGYDLSYIEIENFLKTSGKLYLNRAKNSPKYSGTVVYPSTSSKTNASIEYEISTPEEFDFTTNNGRPFVGESAITVISADNKIQTTALFFEKSKTGDKVRFTKDTADTFPVEIVANTDYYIVKGISPFIQIASSKANAIAATPTILTLSDDGLGSSFKIVNNEVTILASIDQASVLFYGANPGDWANLIEIKTTNYSTNQILVKEPGCFYLEIFYKGYNTGEAYICSFDKDKKSKYGSSLFVEEVLKGSKYLRARANVNVSSSTLIKENSTVGLALAKGLSDASISEADLIAALQPFRNTKKYSIQFISDFGITLPGFQKEIIDICEKRGDCAFILSVPIDVQDANNFMDEIVQYKTTDLNSASNYGVIYSGHCEVTDSQIGRKVWISPSGLMAAKAVAVWDSGKPWEIIANTRATLNVTDVRRHFEEEEESILVDNGINPIRFSYGEGIKAWGERTLQIAPTAFDRFHVRLLFNYMKPAMRKALEPFLFELNNMNEEADSVMSTIEDVLGQFLSDIQSQGGIYGFEVQCNRENNTEQNIVNSELNVDVYLTPAYGIEKIHLNLTANNNFIVFNN